MTMRFSNLAQQQLLSAPARGHLTRHLAAVICICCDSNLDFTVTRQTAYPRLNNRILAGWPSLEEIFSNNQGETFLEIVHNELCHFPLSVVRSHLLNLLSRTMCTLTLSL